VADATSLLDRNIAVDRCLEEWTLDVYAAKLSADVSIRNKESSKFSCHHDMAFILGYLFSPRWEKALIIHFDFILS
jgi:hypothetical protein